MNPDFLLLKKKVFKAVSKNFFNSKMNIAFGEPTFPFEADLKK